jgi:uncharacterized membrane protein YeaQ/YmgE (transglycosylase-associated protein family)
MEGNWLTWLIVGAVAGILADFLVSGIRLGLIGKIIVGIIGAFLGGWIFSSLGISIGTGLLAQIIHATIGAILILVVLALIRRKR